MTIKDITHLKILGKDYKVEWFTPDPVIIQEIEGREQWSSGRILINGDLDEDRALDILIHEVIHAINDDMKIKIEEDDVNRLGAALQAVIRDNKETLRGIL
jgi:hypothetical protein